MKRRMFAASFALAAVAVLGLAGPVAAGEQVPFKGKLDGAYTVTVNPGPPPVGTFIGSGAGNATHLGDFTYEFPHTVNFGTLPPTGIGTYTFTAGNGDTLSADFIGHSTPVISGVVLVVEEAVITGGTGRFANASGSFVVTRLVDQINQSTTGSFEGTVSSPGPANP